MTFTYDVSMFQETFEKEFTYINGFLRNVRRFANKTAMTDPVREKTWTYAELNNEVNKLAHALQEEGIGKNNVVMYQLFNSAEFVYFYLAPQKLGAINSPINFRLSSGETADIIDHSKPDVYVYDAEIKEKVEKALEIAEHKPRWIIMVCEDATCEVPKGHIEYGEFTGGHSSEEPILDYSLHIYGETTRLYTSGTTGVPKGVPLNSINEVLSAHDVAMHFPLSPRDKTMNMTPWFHRGGIHSGGPCPTLYIGGEIIIMRHFTPKKCLTYVEKYDISFLIGVPSVLKTLYKLQKRKPADLSPLKGIVTMGAPLAKEEAIEFQETLTPNIFNGYGTSEAFWNTFLRPYDMPEMAGTAGRASMDDEVAVVKVYPDRRAEPDETVAKDGKEVGEVIVKAPAKTTYTYIHNEEESKRTFYKGWIYIGDMATWDENEFITIVGRKDDMIVSAGENIHPVQVEEILNTHPKVDESLVVGVPDALRGQSVVAYIVKQDHSLTVEELEAYCSEHSMLASYKKPRHYRFVEDLPYTATGKKKHFMLRQQALKDKEEGLFVRG